MKKNCVVCGIEFEARTNGLICSQTCRNSRRTERVRERIVTELGFRARQNAYAAKYREQASMTTPVAIRKCIMCNVIFEAVPAQRRKCSERCAKELKLRYDRERNKNLAGDPAFNAAKREKYKARTANPETRKSINESRRLRREDPTYRAREIAQERRRREDPAYRERLNAAQNERGKIKTAALKVLRELNLI